jgi:hypothetical protein
MFSRKQIMDAMHECDAPDYVFMHMLLAMDAIERAATVATVTECEACMTPDVCQLRGTCDHYAAERLRIAKVKT